MNIMLYIKPAIILIFLSLSFYANNEDKQLAKLKKLETYALKKSIIGKTYTRDLVGNKGCNKTEIKYLGEIQTKKGKRFKILTSFFVHGNDIICHGNSAIKIYDFENRYVGVYYVGMPDDLPDSLINNKILYLDNSEDCNKRKGYSIDFGQGLPNHIFIPCTKQSGDLYYFSSD
jgi:hypothetical protein